ncbi:MAG: ABC transporter permease [Lachnospiraceae bacterium]|nr:ABC transporter permease [Lachnospiraceae bacterium]
MPRISTIGYSVKQGVKNIKRNRMFSLASIGTMTACLFLFGIFYFIVANFQFIVKNAESSVGVTVFFEEGISESQIAEIGSSIKMRAEVSEYKYMSAEETWENYKEKLSEEAIATFGDDNPLENSAHYIVYLNDVSMQDALVRYLEELDGVRQVNDSEEIAGIFSGINRVVGYVSIAIIAILIGVAMFLISTTVTTGISVRKQEISIMKLIGATDFFIRAPFIVEGVLIGTIGSLIPLTFLYGMYHKVVQYISDEFSNPYQTLQFLEVGTVFHTLVPVSLALGIGIGFLGSYLTLGKQLRKIN